ncbi:MAG: hypothetical protein U0172_14350 [Nitrospiraceae bacterium]
MSQPVKQCLDRNTRLANVSVGVYTALCLLSLAGCKPDDSPLRAENEDLKKKYSKQESVISSLQDGNKVMQQQIDLLNQELRDAKDAIKNAKKETEQARGEIDRARGETKEVAAKLSGQIVQTKKLSDEVQRTAAAQAASTVKAEDKGGQSEEFPRPMAQVAKAAEDALQKNGYSVKVGIRLEQKAVYVTERKISPPSSLEASGFRNQFLVSLQALPGAATKLTVKADFEKMAQGNRILPAGGDEAADIEQRLIAEVSKSLASSTKL